MKRIFSGVQPTGQIHLGNFVTMKRHVFAQDEYDCIYCIVDLHSITVPQNPEELRKHSRDLAALYIAMGLDYEKAILFIQSQVSAHAELSWLLQCNCYMGELSRMTQFKDKSSGQSAVTTGLFTYPVLMAADILLYDTDCVPVGDDQKQHIELTRDIALRFNNRFGDTFVIPDPMIAEQGARIMSLDDPSKKMSKSNPNPLSKICVLDSPEQIKKALMKATTDSEGSVKYDFDTKPGVSNLLEIYSLLSGVSIPDIEDKYAGMGYGQFKKDLVEITVEALRPVQERYQEITQSGAIDAILKNGAERASHYANGVLHRVKDKLGMVQY